MNKEIIAILGVGVAVLVAIWMTWRDVTFQLTDMNARLGWVEGVLMAGEHPLARWPVLSALPLFQRPGGALSTRP